jgi:hypothetical protein
MGKEIDSKDSIELAIRGEMVAKSALELLNGHMDTTLARLYFVEIVKGLKELDVLITRLENGKGEK